MTYLELVNSVLRRLRETEVTTVNQTTYSTMVGDYINDAKRQIEQSWDWSVLRDVTELTVTSGTFLYTPGFTEDVVIHGVFDPGNNTEVRQTSKQWIDKQRYTQDYPSGQPNRWAFYGAGASGPVIALYPSPDANGTLYISNIQSQAELVNDADVLSIPERPVYLLATAMLAEERGEFGGIPSARYFEMADRSLQDAIAYDSSRQPTETVWYTSDIQRIRGR